MKNKEINILVGIPASGKSTWSKDFIRNNPDWVRINRDDYRFMLRNESFCEPKVEDMITKLVFNATREALKKKLNVILDATHVRVKYIEQIIEEFKYEADIKYQVFDISVSKAIERDNARDKKVGEEVIKNMFKNYQDLMGSFHFQPQKMIRQRPQIKPEWISSKPNAIIVDIDGTLAHMGNRGPFDWHKVGVDDVNSVVRFLVESITKRSDQDMEIILLSGRDSSCRKETEDWLDFYQVPYNQLLMRKQDDFRKDNIIKEEIYRNNIEPFFNVLFVIDDRLQVLEMWNKIGLFTINVNQGNIDF